MTKVDIQRVIDEDINPGSAMHGGFISIHEFNEERKSLKLIMGGGCQGCSSAKISMIFAVERQLREEFPGIGEIEDMTDHLAGENPYYSKGE